MHTFLQRSTVFCATNCTQAKQLTTLRVHQAVGQRAFRTMASSTQAEASTSQPEASSSSVSQLLSVAPMMDWTDLHYRQLARLLSKQTVLYTEMVVDQTVIHTPFRDKFLWFPPEQHPIVCQLGGSDPAKLAAAAKIVAEYGYDEINLNCGCPSDRVAGAGCFGAAMMLQPKVVAECCQAMADASGGIPITVKCRLGVDDKDSYAELCRFIQIVSEGSPVTQFIIHSRKCLLKGLSPHQNRTIPPLRYSWVYALKRDFPHLTFYLNGGIDGYRHAESVLAAGLEGHGVGGVMIGRAAYYYPWDCLADVDRAVYGCENNAAVSRREVLEAYMAYGDSMIGRWEMKEDGWRSPGVRALIRPIMGLFHGAPNVRKWKQSVDAALKTATSVSGLLKETLVHVSDDVLDAPPTQMEARAAFELPEDDVPMPFWREPAGLEIPKVAGMLTEEGLNLDTSSTAVAIAV